MDQTSIQHYLFGLLAIGNNVSALGYFLLQTKNLPRPKVRRLIMVTTTACAGMLLLFMLVGASVLDFFGISNSAFQIAGGVLLGGVGLDMMQARQPEDVPVKSVEHTRTRDNQQKDSQLYSLAVVPIAVPLTVGAGTFSAVILYAERASKSGASLNLFFAIMGLVLFNYIIFLFSARIVKFAGELGLSVFIKIMGLFTLAIGVEFIVEGLSSVYLGLHSS